MVKDLRLTSRRDQRREADGAMSPAHAHEPRRRDARDCRAQDTAETLVAGTRKMRQQPRPAPETQAEAADASRWKRVLVAVAGIVAAEFSWRYSEIQLIQQRGPARRSPGS